jgi:hypothetical protein
VAAAVVVASPSDVAGLDTTGVSPSNVEHAASKTARERKGRELDRLKSWRNAN